MTRKKEKKNNPHNNPDPPVVTIDLCKAYRKAIETKIDGVEQTLSEKIKSIRNTIIVGLSISTAVISIIVAILNLL